MICGKAMPPPLRGTPHMICGKAMPPAGPLGSLAAARLGIVNTRAKTIPRAPMNMELKPYNMARG